MASASFAWTLDLDLVTTGAVPGGTAPWLRFTATDVSPNTVDLRIDHLSSSVAPQFVSIAYLNLDPAVSGLSLVSETNANKRTGWAFGQNSQNAPGGNSFDLSITFSTSNASGGANRLKPGEFWQGRFSGSSLNANSFDFFSNGGYQGMAHVQGIGQDGAFSGHVAAVPEPGTMALLAIGAVGLVRARRRRA